MSAAVANALPPSILALFAPRPPVEFKPPIQKRKCRPYSSMATLVAEFEDPATAVQQLPAPLPESKEARRERIAKLRAEQAAEKVAAAAESYDPNSDTKIKGDPYKTLFVARINYESTEAKIKKEFEQFGPIKRIRLVLNTDSGKPRGYAFFEYEQERDMKTAYKQADGRKIDGRRVLVDVERGRTVRNWKPRRLGGGLGSTRVAKTPKRQGVQPSMGSARSVSNERGGGDSVAADRGGGPAGGPPPYSGGAPPAAGKLMWATERRDDGGGGPPRGPVGRPPDRPRDERRDERDRGRDRGRDDKRDDQSRERRDRDRDRDRDRARDRGDRGERY